jgi:hypothetical protein
MTRRWGDLVTAFDGHRNQTHETGSNSRQFSGDLGCFAFVGERPERGWPRRSCFAALPLAGHANLHRHTITHLPFCS